MKLAALLLCAGFLVGCAHEQADNATMRVQTSVLNYVENTDRQFEKLIERYREVHRQVADEMNAASMAAIVKPDGTAPAYQVQSVVKSKLLNYAKIEEEISVMRKAHEAAKEDIANAMTLLEGLRGYWTQRQSAAEAASQTGDSLIRLLEDFLAKKAEPKP